MRFDENARQAWQAVKASVATAWSNHQEPDEHSSASLDLDEESGMLVYQTATDDLYEEANPVRIAQVSYEVPLAEVDTSKLAFEALHVRISLHDQRQGITCTRKLPGTESQSRENSVLIRLGQAFFSAGPADTEVKQLFANLETVVGFFRNRDI